MSHLSVSFQDVENAAERIRKYVQITPLLESPLLSEALGFRLLVKAENLQVTGSFKSRGAFNQILQLSRDDKCLGVFAMSAGNHAQGVAYASRTFNIKAAILMPHDAPRLKLENTRAYGAEVLTYDRATENRDEIGRKIAQDRNLRIIHPYNDLRTIAGQGTIGLEIQRQAQETGVVPSAIIIPCSGGGLAAGIAITREGYSTSCQPRIYTAEPAGFDDMKHSLETGAAVTNERQSGTICDALAAPTPGENTLKIWGWSS